MHYTTLHDFVGKAFKFTFPGFVEAARQGVATFTVFHEMPNGSFYSFRAFNGYGQEIAFYGSHRFAEVRESVAEWMQENKIR